jgi:tape measure domain-containing protein
MLTLDDHTLQLQWDSSRIDKGFQDLERKFAKYQNMNVGSGMGGSGERKTRTPRESGTLPLSNNQRDTQRRQIEGLKIRAERDIAELRKVNSKEAQVRIKKLVEVVKSLDKDLASLAKITDKNSKEFTEFGDSVTRSRRAVASSSKATKSMTRQMKSQMTAAKGLKSSLDNLARSWISVFAVIQGVGALKRVSAEMENIRVASLLASGSSKKSAEDLVYVNQLTERLGLRYKDTAKAFATFNVGALSGGVDEITAKKVFTQISEGLASAGTSADSAKLAFLGFRQMISGSVVQAQEINQIVDQVPAFSGAAVQALDEMGLRSADHFDKATKSFKDTIKTAGVDAKEFTKIVARILSDQGRTSGALEAFMQSMTAAENRMINSTNKAIEGVANAGMTDIFMNSFGGLSNIIEAVTPLAIGLAKVFGELSNAIAFVFNGVDKLGMALGLSEGQGIQGAIRLLIGLFVMKFIPALGRAIVKLREVGVAAVTTGKSFLGMSKDIKTADAQTKTLGKSLRGLMRVLWPLMAIEFAITLFKSGDVEKYQDMARAAKEFAEAQAESNKKMEDANWLFLTFYKIGEMIEKVYNSIREDIGVLIEFMKLDYWDQMKTAYIETVNLATFGGLKASGLVETPLSKVLNKQSTEADLYSKQIIGSGGTTVVHTYNIDGADTGLVERIIKESMPSILDNHTQSMYLGGN